MARRTPKNSEDVGPEEARRSGIGNHDDDVVGHGIPVTPPPSFGSKVPGHGGELAGPEGAKTRAVPIDDEDDVEGHARRPGY